MYPSKYSLGHEGHDQQLRGVVIKENLPQSGRQRSARVVILAAQVHLQSRSLSQSYSGGENGILKEDLSD